MKITVVLATYNGEKYVIELLKSLHNQKRTIDELLIFDDKSTDNTIPLIKKFIDKKGLDDKWHIYINDYQKGWKRNFRDGIYLASGDIVFPCDQDDIWHDDKIDTMTKFMEEHQDCLLLCSNYNTIHEKGMKNHERICKINGDVEHVKFDRHFAIGGIRPGCTMAIRKELISLTRDHWLEWYPHDSFLWTEAVIHNGCYILNQNLISFRRHEGSASTFIRRTKVAHIEAMKRTRNIINYYKDKDVEVGKEEIFSDYVAFSVLREQLFNEHKLTNFFKLMKYRGFYRSIKQEVGDLYFLFAED